MSVDPCDLQAEQSLLGAVLLSPAALVEATALVAARDFARSANGLIWSAAVELTAGGQQVDELTVAFELERRGWLADAGGHIGIREAVAACPTTANVASYARRVSDLAHRRRLVTAGLALRDAASDPTVPTALAAEEVRGLLDSAPTQRSLAVYDDDDLDRIPPPAWLIDPVLADGLTVLWGPSGGTKSFTALDWSCSLAAGHRWFGLPVKHGRVVYVAAEGAPGLGARRRAWMADRDAGTKGLRVVAEPVDLLDPADLLTLTALVAEHTACLLVVDTLALCMGGDENDTADMSRFVAACARLRVRTGAAVLVVHHAGKDGTLRGNSALYAAADQVIHSSRDHSSGVSTLTADYPKGKSRNGEPFTPWRLALTKSAESAVLTLASEQRLEDRIAETLQGRGEMTATDLARLLGAPVSSVRAICDRRGGLVLQRLSTLGPTLYAVKQEAI